jgi:hypothetical protein
MIHVFLMAKGLPGSSVAAGGCCAGNAAQPSRQRASNLFIVAGS